MKQASLKKPKSSLVLALFLAALILLGYGIVRLVAHHIRQVEQNTQEYALYQELYTKLGGYKTPQTTLLALANNAEIRLGGGFVGTVGLIRADKGKITMSPLLGTYQIDSSKNCDSQEYSQPEYLKVLSPCPSLRDSANSIDFATNAKKMLYFYQLNKDQSVTNVVQITPAVLEGLLEQLGPVELKEYNLTITNDNFRDTVQLEVEAGKDKIAQKDPKSGVLGSLTNVLITRLLTQDIVKFREYVPFLQEMILQKHLVLYSKNQPTQQLIEQIKAAGDIKNIDDNYFMLAEANYAANKNSPYIKNYVTMHQTVLVSGESQIDVSIRSVHTSDYKIPYIDPNTNQSNYIVGDAQNYVQLALPPNIQLVKTSRQQKEYSVTSDTANNKLLINYDISLKPLSETTTNFSYKVPTKYYFGDKLVVNNYFQKQLGGWPYDLTYSLSIEDYRYNLVASNVKNVQLSDTTTQYSGTINKDTLLSFIYEKSQ